MSDVWAIADIHLNPGDEYDKDWKDLDELILVGDIFNIIPRGMQAWRTDEGWRTIRSLVGSLPKRSKFVLGNHEGRLSWLEELVGQFGFPCYRRYDTFIGKDRWRFTHGHRFSEWWLLRHIADDVVEWAVSTPGTKQLWYDFCRNRGWMATGMAHSNDKYVPFIAGVWSLALKEAHEDRVNMCIGHTHTRAMFNTDWQCLVNLGCNEPKFIGSRTHG